MDGEQEFANDWWYRLGIVGVAVITLILSTFAIRMLTPPDPYPAGRQNDTNTALTYGTAARGSGSGADLDPPSGLATPGSVSVTGAGAQDGASAGAPVPATTSTDRTATTRPGAGANSPKPAPAKPNATTAAGAGATTSGKLWAPPSTMKTGLAQVWQHQVNTYPELTTLDNYLWDQIMAAKGNLNYCVRWESSQTVSAAERDQIQATLARQFQKWMDAMSVNGSGWNGWPYPKVNVKIVGWAVKDRAQLQWTDDSVDVYVNNIDPDEKVVRCEPKCARSGHLDHRYPDCPGGYDHHFDVSLWLTDGFAGGTGGDWGQRVGTEYFLQNLHATNLHLLLHEMGHGFGLDDFCDWTPPGTNGFLMEAGTATQITAFDQWMIRDWWRHLKHQYGL